MKKLLLASALVAFVAGCASSGVVKVGNNEYMMSDQSSISWSGGAVVADLVKEASAFCAKDGLQFKLTNQTFQDAQSYPVARYASGMIQFRCVMPEETAGAFQE